MVKSVVEQIMVQSSGPKILIWLWNSLADWMQMGEEMLY